ncbi:hypothetical protein [Enterococcus hermanniensis]|nr:hypothetical protein [Enterococcus hermanniensis]
MVVLVIIFLEILIFMMISILVQTFMVKETIIPAVNNIQIFYTGIESKGLNAVIVISALPYQSSNQNKYSKVSAKKFNVMQY